MAKTLIFNSRINRDNLLEIRNSEAGPVLFVEYKKEDRCNKCALYYYSDSCKSIPCTKKERTDKATGYYRLYRAKVRDEQPMPRPSRLMMILIAASLLITGCTINMRVVVENKIETPEAAKDSASVKIENNWY